MSEPSEQSGTSGDGQGEKPLYVMNPLSRPVYIPPPPMYVACDTLTHSTLLTQLLSYPLAPALAPSLALAPAIALVCVTRTAV